MSRATRADANAWSILFEACRCPFMSANKADFQWALAIWWLRFVIVEIFDVPCIGEDVSLAPRKLKTV